jgi:hypothetical protein
MTDAPLESRESMYEMIENAAKIQKTEQAWIGNLYRQRLKDLQETEVKRREWIKSQQKLEANDEIKDQDL